MSKYFPRIFIGLIIGGVAGYFLGQVSAPYLLKYFNPKLYEYTKETQKEELLIKSIGMDTYVFGVTKQMTHFFNATSRYLDVVRYPQYEDLKLTAVERLFDVQDNDLEKALVRAADHYNNPKLSQAIKAYLIWLPAFKKRVSDWAKLSKQEREKKYWTSFITELNQNDEPIENVLREIVGFYDIDDKGSALTMLVVKPSIEELKSKPNDPKLCLVMHNDSFDAQVRAQQIAFMKVGQKYCSKYYNKLSSWVGGKYTHDTDKPQTKYDTLSYQEYYNKYVLKSMPVVLSGLSKTDWGYKVCAEKGLMFDPRNPKQDAFRVIWRKHHKSHCPKLTNLKSSRFANSPLICLISGRFLGDRDLFQRCKLTEGVLL